MNSTESPFWGVQYREEDEIGSIALGKANIQKEVKQTKK